MTLSFEGAEGYGANATGGRGGQIIKVTNSNDSGEGSLRWAIEEVSGPRIIIFEVNEVNLTDNISLSDGDVTIAGQTAGGVQVTGATIAIKDSNVIIQGMMFRPGDSSVGENPDSRDALTIGGSGSIQDIMIDHNSFEWAVDENVAIYRDVSDVTFSNNIVAQALHDSIHPEGTHSKGFLVYGDITRITVSDNLFAYNDARNPWFKNGEQIEFVNNYIFGAGRGDKAIDLGHDGDDDSITSMSVNVLNNYYVTGPDTYNTDEPPIRIDNLAPSQFYIDGNLFLDRDGNEMDQIYHGESTEYVVSSTSFGSGLTILDAADVGANVLANAGANPLNRDEVDQRIIDLVASGQGGLVDSVAEAGGWGTLPNFVAPLDSDNDGMPDWFEDQFSFDKNSFDAHGDSDGDGYTNIEEYINGLLTGFDLMG